MGGLDKHSDIASIGGNQVVNPVVSYERKPVYFDIPAHWHNPDACGRAIDAMMYQLKEKYQGRYKFSHDEKLPPFDSKGQSITTRRHYYVDTEVTDLRLERPDDTTTTRLRRPRSTL
jgi:hypothetical protein